VYLVCFISDWYICFHKKKMVLIRPLLECAAIISFLVNSANQEEALDLWEDETFGFTVGKILDNENLYDENASAVIPI